LSGNLSVELSAIQNNNDSSYNNFE